MDSNVVLLYPASPAGRTSCPWGRPAFLSSARSQAGQLRADAMLGIDSLDLTLVVPYSIASAQRYLQGSLKKIQAETVSLLDLHHQHQSSLGPGGGGDHHVLLKTMWVNLGQLASNIFLSISSHLFSIVSLHIQSADNSSSSKVFSWSSFTAMYASACFKTAPNVHPRA